MTPYGYISKRYRFVFGPNNFELSSAQVPLTPIYLKPQYPEQEPWAGVVPNIGIFYFYRENIGQFGIEPFYLGVKL
jgi:hypothetical protein